MALIRRSIGLGYCVVSPEVMAPTTPPIWTPLNTLPMASTTANAGPMTGAAATPSATPAPAPTLAPVDAPSCAPSREELLTRGAVVLVAAAAPAGVSQVICSGEFADRTVMEPGAENHQFPAELAALQ